MDKVTKKEVRRRRSNLLSSASKKIYINKEDKRIKGHKVCGICGRSLTNIIGTTGKTYVAHKHIRCKYNSFIHVNLCNTAQMCYTELRKKGWLIENEDV